MSHIAPGRPRSQASPVPRRRVLAWGAWDWGSSAFNAVMTTFVFTVWLVSPQFGDPDRSSAVLGWALGASGLVLALLAPVLGQRSDAGGRRKLWLVATTLVVVALCAAGAFVRPAPEYLLLGVGLIAAATLFFELASVNYNAMLADVSTPATAGKVSGFGWSLGYFGGIAALVIVLFGFVKPVLGLPVPTEDGWPFRLTAVFSALWFLVFALPLFFLVPETRADEPRAAKVSVLESYRILGRRLAGLWRTDRHAIWFLAASAVFRDGLAAVFTLGGAIATVTFGFTQPQVIVFAIAGNIVAALGALLGGRLDDRLGPKRVILGALAGLLVAAGFILALNTRTLSLGSFTWSATTTFWVFGLFLCLFVGPAQSASRSYLLRLAPEGKESEFFGLYATTGRAVSFLAPSLFSLCIAIGGRQIHGVVGIALVLAAGLLALLPVREPTVRPET
ncbi:MFS transporter [Arthrobacter sp. UM1]|uniref:MFS transporter n=1 Tax=Arthrobacter sp. UM1 TaxID=2766776 RepID=UPI001CF64734|nr:MFS transporter [Arthrobacter sp. UM1]MCB4208463.1 MFS transporter [Arthrobacter sp. UM1]